MQSTPTSFSKFFDLSWRIFARNIRAAHRKSFLGMIWLVLPPLINAGVWVLLNKNGVIDFDPGAGVSYAIFALSGILIWQMFLDALQTPFSSMETFEPIIKSLYFNRFSILGAATLEILFNVFIRLGIVLAGLILFQVPFYWQAFLSLIPIVILLLLGLGFSLWILPIFMLYKDVGRLLGFATQFAFFLTPIVYRLPKTETLFSKIAYWNPVTPPLLAARDLMLTGSTGHWGGALWVLVFSIILVTTGLKLYKITCERIIERI